MQRFNCFKDSNGSSVHFLHGFNDSIGSKDQLFQGFNCGSIESRFQSFQGFISSKGSIGSMNQLVQGFNWFKGLKDTIFSRVQLV